MPTICPLPVDTGLEPRTAFTRYSEALSLHETPVQLAQT
jgi:hypothetical protein